jgi:hypothetical protein
MFGLGILLGMFDKVFLRPSAGLLFNSIGVSLLPALLPVDMQLAQYIAGLGQQIAVAVIVFAPMFEIHGRRKRWLAPSSSRSEIPPRLRALS